MTENSIARNLAITLGDHRYLVGFVLYRAKPLIVTATTIRSDKSTSDRVECLVVLQNRYDFAR
jgi:hypothetical protein